MHRLPSGPDAREGGRRSPDVRRPARSRGRLGGGGLLLLSCFASASFSFTAPGALASVSDVVWADVTTRSFAGVWASDEPVGTATVHVFADSGGTTELTSGLTVALENSGLMLLRGIVLVRVEGLAASTCVYVQTETSGSATVFEPAAPPFPQVCTAARTEKAGPLGTPYANDVLVHPIFEADGATPADGAVAVLAAPGSAAAPLVGIAGAGTQAPDALFDLSNLFAAADGASLEVAEGEVLEVREYRGLGCTDPAQQALLRFRRVPAHEEVASVGAAITELELPALCYGPDAVCDDVVDIRDVQRVLNAFGASTGDCDFNPDLDVVQDGTVDLQDAQDVLDQLGASAPFP